MTQGGPLLILGFKGQVHTSFDFEPFPHDDSISIWHKMMILHTCIGHDPRSSIDVRDKRSRSYFYFELYSVSA